MDVVFNLHNYITLRDYAAAWSRFTPEYRSGHSFEAWKSGYSQTTRSTSIEVSETIEGRSAFVEASINWEDSEGRDGSVWHYYRLDKPDGVWRIAGMRAGSTGPQSGSNPRLAVGRLYYYLSSGRLEEAWNCFTDGYRRRLSKSKWIGDRSDIELAVATNYRTVYRDRERATVHVLVNRRPRGGAREAGWEIYTTCESGGEEPFWLIESGSGR
ncbi:MAG: hypothetical protein IT204_25960 [Fimbriimonadaceae bacterium]|nr:hypothetical protein [Fimbriimonadaceae bacterium]